MLTVLISLGVSYVHSNYRLALKHVCVALAQNERAHPWTTHLHVALQKEMLRGAERERERKSKICFLVDEQ